MNFFFHPKRRMDLNWRNHTLRVGSVTPHNKKQISEGLRDMSPESIRYRFLGSKREFTEKELSYLTTLDGLNHYAIGMEERDTSKGIAIIRMVRSSKDESEAEVAITIIDEYQKAGLGQVLMKLMVLAAAERNIQRLSFTYLPANEGIIKLLHKVGPVIPGPQTKDFDQSFLAMSSLDLKKIREELIQFIPDLKELPL